jgi:Kef-type K+ transport system membrane component KefB
MSGSIFPVEDPIVIFAIVACLILVIPFVMAKLKMPALVGLLLAGAIFGPNALHLLDRDQSFILLGKVGLMFIMFIAALEVDLGVFKKFGVHAAVFGVLTFAIPLAAAAPVAFYVLGYAVLPGILLASVFSSHTLLAYPMASKLGIAKNRAVTTAVGGTMIADTAALLLLAVIVGMKVEGKVDRAFWMQLVGSLSIYGFVIFFGLPRIARWLFRRVGEDGNVQFAFVLAAVFLCAGAAHPAGVEPIVGAFLAGLALNRLIPHNGALMNRIQFVGEAVFIPFFLISVGMLLDASVLFTGFSTWIIVIYMTVMVLVTKFAAAEATRLFLRFEKAEARVVFSLTLAQAAATLAVVQVAYNVGLFDKTVVNGSIVMILVTCTISPMVMARYGPEVAKREAAAAAAEHIGPRQRILVGLQSLVTAQPMIELSLLLRDPAQRQALYLVHATCDDEHVEHNVGRAEKMLHDAVMLCSSADVPAETSTSIDQSISAALVRSTKALQASHLVLDWNFESPSGNSVLGSTVDELLRTNSSTLLLFRSRHPVPTTRNIAVAVPPVAFNRETLGAAITAVKRVAQQLGAPIEVLADDETWTRCRAVIEPAKPEVKLKYQRLEHWDSLRQALLDRTSTSDLLVILGAREAAPEIARTAILVAERFPDASLALIYGTDKSLRSDVIKVAPLAPVAGAPTAG